MNTIVVTAPCVRNGERCETELSVSLNEVGDGLPVLVIMSDWSVNLQDWRRRTVVRLEEVPTPLGRGFLLRRSETDMAKDGPDAEPYYSVLIANPQDETCSCRGYQSHGHCRHVSAIRGLIENEQLPHAEAARPVEVFPSPRQVADELPLNMPF
jgi:hypothetical protein